MAIHVECKCGKSFEVSEKNAGKSGRCKACGAPVTVPSPPSVDPVTEPFIQIEVEPATAPIAPNRARSRWPSHAVTGVVGILIGVGATFGIGVGSPEKRKELALPSAKPVKPDLVQIAQPPHAQVVPASSDRQFNPFRVAALHWEDSEETIARGCQVTTERSEKRGKIVHATTVAAMLTECGKAEQEWRGKERCAHAVSCLRLMDELLADGTAIEDVFILMVKIYRMHGRDRPKTPEAAADQQAAAYEQLKRGNSKNMTEAYKGFLELMQGLSNPPDAANKGDH